MLKGTIKSLTMAALLAASAISAQAADYTIRATANSNENDEDYDGLVVFKNYVESASNGAIEVELFIGTQLCSKGAECLQGVADGSIDVYISHQGVRLASSPMCRFWICPISWQTTGWQSMFCQVISPARSAKWRWKAQAIKFA